MQEIKIIKASDTLDIRHKVMWPNKPKSYVKLPNDANGNHFGLFINKKLISVISLFTQNGSIQFRKFATLNEYQGNGYGSQLLTYIIEYSKKQNTHKIWCNARIDKTSYYHKFGLKETNRTFEKGGIQYVIMECVF